MQILSYNTCTYALYIYNITKENDMLKLIQDSLARQQSDEYQQNKDNVQQLDNIILCLQDSMKINSGSDLALIKAELLHKYIAEKAQLVKYIETYEENNNE